MVSDTENNPVPVEQSETPAEQPRTVYVWELPVRIWHWVQAIAIFVLAITGYLIASPPPTLPGEASDNFLLGYIRYVHFASGYVIAIAFVARGYWAIVGNKYSRELVWPGFQKKSFWEGTWHQIKWYMFLENRSPQHAGHNPLSVATMHVMLVWGTLFMIVTGFAMYGEGTGMGTWQYDYFTSWVVPLFGQSQDVHTWHHFGMWYLLTFVIIHLYAAFHEELFSSVTMINTILSGWRTFKK